MANESSPNDKNIYKREGPYPYFFPALGGIDFFRDPRFGC